MLPNCTAPLIVQASLGVSTAILDAAALGFLGLGAQPPASEWGTMLADAREFVLRAWWVVTFPGLAILITVLAFNFLGDGLRDALDPKLKRGDGYGSTCHRSGVISSSDKCWSMSPTNKPETEELIHASVSETQADILRDQSQQHRCHFDFKEHSNILLKDSGGRSADRPSPACRAKATFA